MSQLAIPIEVNPAEVMRKRSLGEAIDLCRELAELEPKKIKIDGKYIDKAQWSRWTDGLEGIKWPKLQAVMDQCGNDVPVLWMLHARHYDLYSLRHVETKLERENRMLREDNAALRRVIQGGLA